MDNITNFISACGFPIVACCALAWYTWQQTKLHKEEVTKLTKVVESNTRATEKLIEKLEGNVARK